jgi:HTH-type transcriptional regulator / antitoxin HipB
MREAFDAISLGRGIRELRNARGWTQQTLAQWLGVSRPTVVSLEQGGPVSVVVAMKAIALLGGKIVVSPKDAILVEGEG